ncbi:1-phosphatidylinositol-4,5-bisphosphate phosphodiesterase delta-3 [Verticillium alfalfae VaMs.102]|uniref:Phosphoinositide phospholipase C n=1 Tax=Verticillium alfalfae (strain VaMs.102 / ATCC MYA-4576 / FGSC 10136) TaxID=526221 RepID=C9SV93_VERA1|nr:1-phosphatidylinositol-4,5-bisphosphate phosphodiesterase delta-3 [Verticillium alfalfae VaMs.102]EEY22708.1 1-phosphatidylinositol-4,5-bisphosphate phosphodiesterase delta-3 [Verticillium alfalfae VaMs.102]
MVVDQKTAPSLGGTQVGGGASETQRIVKTLNDPIKKHLRSVFNSTAGADGALYSESSTDAYKNVLLRGCRCIEIDVWDGDDSDSESSISSDEEGTAPVASAPKKKEKKESRLQRLKDKVPNPLARKLKRLSLTGSEAAAKPSSSETKTPAASSEPSALKKTPSPQLAIVEPRVLHGYTLTKEVSFRDVCVTIRDYAFKTTDTPLIASLEVHCSAEQQSIMVKIMKEVWAELLVPTPDAEATQLPQPGQLRNKIIVKVKYAPPGSSPGRDTPDQDDETPADGKKAKPSKITQELSDLGFNSRGVSFKSLDQPEAAMPTHIFSLAEKKVIDVHEENSKALFAHNQNYMMRAYPSGMRIRSSNLDPAPFWRKGIQIVALNWQRWDEGMMLNEGMFAGTHGYVLKPEGYRGSKGVTHVENVVPASQIIRKTLDLQIDILAAQNIPLPPGDDDAKGFKPYVKVELHIEGPEEHIADDGQEREGEYKERTQTLRGRDPDFGGEALKFTGITGVVEGARVCALSPFATMSLGRDDLSAWPASASTGCAGATVFVHLSRLRGHLTPGRAALCGLTKLLAIGALA